MVSVTGSRSEVACSSSTSILYVAFPAPLARLARCRSIRPAPKPRAPGARRRVVALQSALALRTVLSSPRRCAPPRHYHAKPIPWACHAPHRAHSMPPSSQRQAHPKAMPSPRHAPTYPSAWCPPQDPHHAYAKPTPRQARPKPTRSTCHPPTEPSACHATTCRQAAQQRFCFA